MPHGLRYRILRLGYAPEWIAGIRRRPRTVAAAWAATAAACVVSGFGGFALLSLAAAAAAGFYTVREPLPLVLLPEVRASRFLARKVAAAWGLYFAATLPAALIAALLHPAEAWLAAVWAPLAALMLCYAVLAKYARYDANKPLRQPAAAWFGLAGFYLPVLLPLSLALTVSYALRAERNLDRYLHDYD